MLGAVVAAAFAGAASAQPPSDAEPRDGDALDASVGASAEPDAGANPAARPAAPPTLQATDEEGDAGDGLQPLAHSVAPWWALAIGALGSLAYLLAAYVGFIGDDDAARNRILARFDGNGWLVFAKTVAFAAIGGGVAMVFQLTEHYLVPVQAFIIGCTWPAVVANYLSARQRGSEAGVEAEVAKALRKAQALAEQERVLDSLPQQPPVDSEQAKARIDDLLNELPED